MFLFIFLVTSPFLPKNIGYETLDFPNALTLFVDLTTLGETGLNP